MNNSSETQFSVFLRLKGLITLYFFLDSYFIVLICTPCQNGHLTHIVTMTRFQDFDALILFIITFD